MGGFVTQNSGMKESVQMTSKKSDCQKGCSKSMITCTISHVFPIQNKISKVSRGKTAMLPSVALQTPYSKGQTCMGDVSHCRVLASRARCVWEMCGTHLDGVGHLDPLNGMLLSLGQRWAEDDVLSL